MVRPGLPKMSPINRMRTNAPWKSTMVTRANWLPELGVDQEVVITGRIQGQIGDSGRVHQNIIEVPEVKIGKIYRKNLLELRIDLLALGLIGFLPPRGNQGVCFGIEIEPAVLAFGREVVRVEGVLENVGIVVPSDPPQRVQLESALRDVCEERSEFIRTNVQCDAYLSKLLLDGGSNQAWILVGRGLKREMETHAAHRLVSGRVQ